MLRTGRAGEDDMDELDTAIAEYVDDIVDAVPGVIGAIVSTIDGFELTSRLPPDIQLDRASIAAMAAASIGLSSRLVQLLGDSPAAISHHRSIEGQVLVFDVDGLAVLAVLADHEAEAGRIVAVSREAVGGLRQLFVEAAGGPGDPSGPMMAV